LIVFCASRERPTTVDTHCSPTQPIASGIFETHLPTTFTHSFATFHGTLITCCPAFVQGASIVPSHTVASRFCASRGFCSRNFQYCEAIPCTVSDSITGFRTGSITGAIIPPVISKGSEATSFASDKPFSAIVLPVARLSAHVCSLHATAVLILPVIH